MRIYLTSKWRHDIRFLGPSHSFPQNMHGVTQKFCHRSGNNNSVRLHTQNDCHASLRTHDERCAPEEENIMTMKNSACLYGLRFGCVNVNGDPNCKKCAERLTNAVNQVLRPRAISNAWTLSIVSSLDALRMLDKTSFLTTSGYWCALPLTHQQFWCGWTPQILFDHRFLLVFFHCCFLKSRWHFLWRTGALSEARSLCAVWSV